MSIIKEFSDLKTKVDPIYPHDPVYLLDDGEEFYIEQAFYTQLKYFKDIFPGELDKFILEMKKIVKENKKVVFVYNFEHPFIDKEDFIYHEFTDVSDRLKILIDDKSRGSDYGD